MQDIVTYFTEHPSVSIPQAGSAMSQRIYRFWSNKRVSHQKILESHRPSVLQRLASHSIVLAIQDTTEMNYSGLKRTTGLGFINQTKQQGFNVHSCLALSTQGEPLGLLHQHIWSRAQRTGKRGERRKKTTSQKESQRWLDTVDAAAAGVDEQVKLVHVGDREADIFDLFSHIRKNEGELLIRLEHNRKVDHELTYLIPTLEQAPILGKTTIEIHRNPNAPMRQAELQVRGISVSLQVPRHHLAPSSHEPVMLNVLLVEEPNPPEGSKPIRWLLATTLPIETFEQAWQCVFWYSLRWRIERFHYTLKSGCKIEQLQLETAERLKKALGTYSIVAWRLMWLTYRARLTPDVPCTEVLEVSEWRMLRRKFEPKNRSGKPPSLNQAIRWIAQLGGFLARKGDGEPGLKTLWRGLGVLHHLLEGKQLAAIT